MSRIHLPTAPVTLNPGFEFYPSIGRAGADASLIVVNFDVQYQLEAESVEPYVGSGLFWIRASADVTVGGLPVSVSDSDMGINLKGGFLFGTAGGMRPFAEGVIALGGGESFMLKGDSSSPSADVGF